MDGDRDRAARGGVPPWPPAGRPTARPPVVRPPARAEPRPRSAADRGDESRRLGLRDRRPGLPAMVAVVLAPVWRPVPSVAEPARVLGRAGLRWAPPPSLRPQAIGRRRRGRPAALVPRVPTDLGPTSPTRAAARSRPLPPLIVRPRAHSPPVWAVAGTTPEALFKQVGRRRGGEGAVLGGKLAAVLDRATKLPGHLRLDPDPAANDQRGRDRLEAVVPPTTLLVMNRGFDACDAVARPTEAGHAFATRARGPTAQSVERVVLDTPTARDRIARRGRSRSNPGAHPMRRVEVQVHGIRRADPTNALAPQVLPAADVVARDARRWRIEEAFRLTTRPLGPQRPLVGGVQRRGDASLGDLAALRGAGRSHRRGGRGPRPAARRARAGAARPRPPPRRRRRRRGSRRRPRRRPRRPGQPRPRRRQAPPPIPRTNALRHRRPRR